MARVDNRGPKDLVISFDFPPEIGGAHKSLYEVFRSWPTRVDVLTHGYSQDKSAAENACAFDSAEHESLRIFRDVRRYGNLSLLNPRFYMALLQCRRWAQKTSKYSPLRCMRCAPFQKALQDTSCSEPNAPRRN